MKFILGFCFGLLSIIAAFFGYKYLAGDAASTITVSASASTTQVPDQASVSTGVVTQAPTAAQALSQNSTKMRATIAELEKAGVQSKNIRTSNLSVRPRYDYTDRQAPRITGYEVNNTVSAKTNDIENVGTLVDALVRAGSNTINGINFSIENPDAARSEAREKAVKAARKKAQELADASGVGLGKVLSIQEGSSGYTPRPFAMQAARVDVAESAPVAPGEQSVSVSVTITYAVR